MDFEFLLQLLFFMCAIFLHKYIIISQNIGEICDFLLLSAIFLIKVCRILTKIQIRNVEFSIGAMKLKISTRVKKRNLFLGTEKVKTTLLQQLEAIFFCCLGQVGVIGAGV